MKNTKILKMHVIFLFTVIFLLGCSSTSGIPQEAKSEQSNSVSFLETQETETKLGIDPVSDSPVTSDEDTVLQENPSVKNTQQDNVLDIQDPEVVESMMDIEPFMESLQEPEAKLGSDSVRDYAVTSDEDTVLQENPSVKNTQQDNGLDIQDPEVGESMMDIEPFMESLQEPEAKLGSAPVSDYPATSDENSVVQESFPTENDQLKPVIDVQGSGADKYISEVESSTKNTQEIQEIAEDEPMVFEAVSAEIANIELDITDGTCQSVQLRTNALS